MLWKLLSSFALIVASAVTLPSPVQAVEITFLCGNALRPAMLELIPEFEKASGHTVKISYGVLGVVTDRLRKDEQADLAIVSPQQWDELQKEGKLGPARTTLAKVGIGYFVTKGAAKPDISSVDAFKRALLGARSVAYVTAPANPVSAYAAQLFQKLGITAEMQAKNKYVPGQGALYYVGRGEAEIGFTQLSEVLAEPTVDLIGPVPAELQSYTVYVAGAPKTAKAPEAAKALVDFLKSSRAAAVFKAKGFEQD